eukprot:6213591-Pleurochrysis_carterae.AAC.3
MIPGSTATGYRTDKNGRTVIFLSSSGTQDLPRATIRQLAGINQLIYDTTDRGQGSQLGRGGWARLHGGSRSRVLRQWQPCAGGGPELWKRRAKRFASMIHAARAQNGKLCMRDKNCDAWRWVSPVAMANSPANIRPN